MGARSHLPEIGPATSAPCPFPVDTLASMPQNDPFAIDPADAAPDMSGGFQRPTLRTFLTGPKWITDSTGANRPSSPKKGLGGLATKLWNASVTRPQGAEKKRGHRRAKWMFGGLAAAGLLLAMGPLALAVGMLAVMLVGVPMVTGMAIKLLSKPTMALVRRVFHRREPQGPGLEGQDVNSPQVGGPSGPATPEHPTEPWGDLPPVETSENQVTPATQGAPVQDLTGRAVPQRPGADPRGVPTTREGREWTVEGTEIKAVDRRFQLEDGAPRVPSLRRNPAASDVAGPAAQVVEPKAPAARSPLLDPPAVAPRSPLIIATRVPRGASEFLPPARGQARPAQRPERGGLGD
jgi:hypothetical protein